MVGPGARQPCGSALVDDEDPLGSPQPDYSMDLDFQDAMFAAFEEGTEKPESASAVAREGRVRRQYFFPQSRRSGMGSSAGACADEGTSIYRRTGW